MGLFSGKNKGAKGAGAQSDVSKTIGGRVSFAAKESYKLLRTNLSYILSEKDAEGCHIIGVTSSLRGEGKSTTSINLAYVLGEMNKRVLLIEADLRIPSLHNKLRVQPKPGLSNALVTRSISASYIQKHVEKRSEGDVCVFDILTAGDIPPNPSELIGSARMKALLDQLAKHYDYIVLDLPPVNAVTDALVATKLVEGVIVVVRNNYTDHSSLNETLRQIQLVNGKVLGFVLTCADPSGSGYGRKYRYRYRYRYRYYKNYYK